jgi:hypothetical protein
MWDYKNRSDEIRPDFKMAPQVGLEPHPEIPTAETIVLKIVKNTRKTSVDAGFEDSPIFR